MGQFKHKFNVGDNVKVVSAPADLRDRKGCTGVIACIDDDYLPYKVQFGDPESWDYDWFKARNLKKVEPKDLLEFKVGDRVRVSESACIVSFRGRVGKVSEVDHSDSDLPYSVTNDEGATFWFRASELSKAIDFAPSKPDKPPVKVGDTVKSTSGTTNGKTGVVMAINSAGDILVKFTGWTGGHFGFYKGKELSDKEDCWWLVEGAWEVTTMETFVPGAKVVVIADCGSSSSPRVGTTGTVVYAYSDSDIITIEFDNWHGGHDSDFEDGRDTCWNYFADDIAKRIKVIPSAGTYIVINRIDGALLPATRPYVHQSKVLAETEALRLANLPSTQGEFIVFKAETSAAVPPRTKAEIKAL